MLAQSEINIAIGDKPPERYFTELAEQCDGGLKKYGGITDVADLRANLRMSCLPQTLLDGEISAYDDFPRGAPQAHGAQDQDLVRGAVMIANLKPYPAMKDSGVLWWRRAEASRVKRFIKLLKE